MQMLLVLPLVAQELFINDIVAKPLKASTLNAKDGDTINDYQEEHQLIDDYLKQINPNFSAGSVKVIVDLINQEHYRCNVFYKQIPVDGYRLTIHPFTDTTLSITGMNLFCSDISVIPSLSKKQAVEKLKLTDNSITDEVILLNELVIYKTLKGEPCLCYKIEILLSNMESYLYYISATNGNIIDKLSLERNLSATIGTADLENWGTQTIFTSYDPTLNKHILFDQVTNIQTYNSDNIITDNNIIDLNLAENFTDSDNNWTFTEFPETYMYSPNAALVCHWGARKTYDFFFTTFNREGYSGDNKKLNIYVNYDAQYSGANAAWNKTNNAIKIGSGNTEKHHYGVVDIVAHEFGHAVTDYMVDVLVYRGESGAIDEGVADIWSACVENYLGASFDEIWNHGDHKGTPSRVFYNPKLGTTKQPNTYGGTYWTNPDTAYDNGGVHINSGILNYWFYLLTVGGSGTNDNQESYEVEGVGFSIAQRILYQTLQCHMEPNSTFAQMRASTLQTTALLYNETPHIYKQVTNAWHAVGIGRPYMSSYITGEFVVCDDNIYSMNFWEPTTTITWSVDSFTNAMNQKRPKLTIVSGQNTGAITVERTPTGLADTNGNLYYYNGNVSLTAAISYANETHIKQKSLFVNTPLPDIQYTTRQVSNISMNKIYKFYVNNVATNYLNWRIEANGSVYTATGQNYIEISLPTTRLYDVIVSVTDNGGCSESNYKTRTLKGVTIVSPILSHENPVTPNSVFYLKKETDEPDEGAVYNIEIWNEYGLIRSEEYENVTEFMVSTEGLIPGVYFMRIYRNGEFLETQKLIIKQSNF